MLTLIAVVGATEGCSSGAVSPSFTRIYGGMPVPNGNFPAVVAIAVDGEPHPFCAGVLIGPRAVLTAGHCLDSRLERGEYAFVPHEFAPSALRVYLGNSLQEADTRDVFNVQSVRTHPLLRASPIGYADFGLIELSEPVEGVVPLRPVIDAALKIKALNRGQATLVGFGKRESGAGGVKYAVTSRLLELNANEVVFGGSGQDACTGDSGGPALILNASGQYEVLGILSRGLNLECGQGAIVELSSAAACWLTQQHMIEAGHGNGLPASYCPTTPKHYSDGELESANFARLCFTKGGDLEQKATVQAILQTLRTSDCRAATTALVESERLNFDGLNISDLSPLAGLNQLRHLSLKGNRISDLESLRHLTNLVVLDIEGNDIRDPKPLPKLVAKGLKIKGLKRQLWNHRDTTFRHQCLAYKQGTLSEASATTVRALLWHASSEDCEVANSRLLMRTTLNLSGRNITELSTLSDFTNLRTLDLSDNPITSVAALIHLEYLKDLDLRLTQVSDASSLSSLVNLGLQIWR